MEIISTQWEKARKSLIDIGRYLNAAKSDPSVPEGEFMKMMKERLPFSWETAHQLRSVAEAIAYRAIPRRRTSVRSYRGLSARDAG